MFETTNQLCCVVRFFGTLPWTLLSIQDVTAGPEVTRRWLSQRLRWRWPISDWKGPRGSLNDQIRQIPLFKWRSSSEMIGTSLQIMDKLKYKTIYDYNSIYIYHRCLTNCSPISGRMQVICRHGSLGFFRLQLVHRATFRTQPSHPAKLLKTFVAFQVVPAHVNDQRKSFKAPLDGDWWSVPNFDPSVHMTHAGDLEFRPTS